MVKVAYSRERMNELFSSVRGTSNVPYKEEKKSRKQVFEKGIDKKVVDNTVKHDNFSRFLEKCENLNLETIDTFTPLDLFYFFRLKSDEANSHYCCMNFKRDVAIFKKLTNSYSKYDICLMIEFAFSPEQTYLTDITPCTLISAWNNTLFKDSQDWAENKPIRTKRKGYNDKKEKVISNREWKKQSNEEESKIGEW